MDPPAAPGAFAPVLSEGPLLSWLEPIEGGHRLVFSRFEGEKWQEVQEVAAGSSMFANWADVPAVVGSAGGRLWSHWLEKLGEGTYAYGVRFKEATRGGSGWTDQGWLHADDLGEAEHGFVSWVTTAAEPWVFWLDGRQVAAAGAMTLRGGRVEGGRVDSRLLDERVCDCCPTDAAMTESGPLVVYRDRSEDEIRDIAIVRWTGTSWSPPARIFDDGWRIAGCPVNGPAVAAAGKRVVVAWFTAPEGRAMVRVAFSDDGGESFTTPFLVDGDDPLGRVDVTLLKNGDAVVAWLARDLEATAPGGSGAALSVRRVSPVGRTGAPRVVARTSPARASGVPRILAAGDDLLLSWVDVGESRLRVSRLPLSRLPRTPR
ncbi:MAG: exo-alpha-sialidase [Acidobacteria bacterium]|nr:exo-alpha-sialidase [Acidobacteriota bacterium]